ncbi:unnamed protein product [Cladocopium goreaui]|uniref:Dapdiamide synthesis protein DdaC n=1 Tax=Cladocopium goreaui TaxID=2562237 RepID=A0A9P1C8Z6_9DINO|nr:unnamed protein product [Cladocopium goreaui]
MAILEDKLHSVQRAKVLKAWQRVSRSARAAHQVLELKQLRLVQILVKRWASTWRAARYQRLRLSAKCWRGFHDEVRRQCAAALVRSRRQDLDARAGLLRWDTAVSLRKREAELRQIVQVRALRVTVQRWYRLKSSKALQVTRILRSYLQGWFAITGHLLGERRQREIENFGTGPGAGPTEWQSRQRRRWQGRCWTPWVQVVQRKRQRRRHINEAKEDLKKLVTLQALHLWHRQSTDSARRKEHLGHASMALMAMVSACRWARAHDCLVYWFTRTQARRIMCKETDLSGETLPLLQPLPSMFAAPVAEMPDSSPWNLRPSHVAPWPTAPWSYPSSRSARSVRSARSARSGDRSGDRCSGPSEILLMSDEEVVDPAMSVSTTLAPVELLCSKMKRWLRLAFLLWQQAELSSAATSLPILQWSWSLWRQSRLRAQVHPLRWWSLALQMHKLRELELRLDFRRLRRTLKAWYDAVAESLKEAVEAAQEELSTCRALFQDVPGMGHPVIQSSREEPSEIGILEPVLESESSVKCLVSSAKLLDIRRTSKDLVEDVEAPIREIRQSYAESLWPPLAMDGKKVVAAAVVPRVGKDEATSACAAYASRSFVASGPAITANQVHKSSFAGAQPATSARAARGHVGAALALPAAGLVAAGRWQRKGRRHARVVRCADGLADCPYVLYGNFGSDQGEPVAIDGRGDDLRQVKACPLEIRMPPELKGDLEGQRQFFSSRLPDIYKDLKEYGAIVFRGFEISKDKGTFGQVGQALQLEPCEDPLHSVAARDAVDKKAGVYEAVNKPSRSKFYIGMHNEMVGDRAPGAALFVCFKAAEEGGEFLVADGRKMFKELDKEWLTKVYNRDVVYSTAEFPMGFIEGLPDFVQPAVEPMVYGAMTQALKMKVDFKTELRWEKSDYDGSKILQVRAMPQYPVLRHHATGEPCWWGSMHSHAEHLRSEREKVYGEAQETTGAFEAQKWRSRINKTDVFYGDDGEKIETEWLEHLDKVTLDCAEKVKMEEGDMVLLDNYLVMHGRCPFEGTRLHAVSWFKSPDYSKAAA